MRVSKYFVPTRKEIPREAEIPSHQMMLRAGLIRQHSAGVYSILPMGWRILRNIMDVIREEMDAIGCQEFFLPICIGQRCELTRVYRVDQAVSSAFHAEVHNTPEADGIDLAVRVKWCGRNGEYPAKRSCLVH